MPNNDNRDYKELLQEARESAELHADNEGEYGATQIDVTRSRADQQHFTSDSWHAMTENEVQEDFVTIEVCGTPPRRHSDDVSLDMSQLRLTEQITNENPTHQIVPAVGLSPRKMAKIEIEESRRYKALSRAKALTYKCQPEAPDSGNENSMLCKVGGPLGSPSRDKESGTRLRIMDCNEDCKICKGRGYVYLQESRIWPCVCMKRAQEDTLVDKAKEKLKSGMNWLGDILGLRSD
jgi:hypothetical protein